MALKVPDNHFPKDSFDRFGDDLSQLVLKHLSLEDRFRFECVSKQWQRVVYQTQQELVIDYQLYQKWPIHEVMSLDWDFMKIILIKKCPNIRAIKIYNYCMNANIIRDIMDSLAKWCPNIRSFEAHSPAGEYYTDLYYLIDRIVVFRELRTLSIDCPYVYFAANPYDNLINILSDCCPHIQSLGLIIYCGDMNNLFIILRDLKLLPELSRLHLQLYGTRNILSKLFSVKPLLECRRLQYVWLDCDQDVDFEDVDQLRRQARRVTITKKFSQLYSTVVQM